MALILLEALGAGLVLVGIIWWTMFSGRKNGELPDPVDEGAVDPGPQPKVEDKNTL